MNSIIEFLNLEDKNLNIDDIVTDEKFFTKTIYLSTTPVKQYCLICGSRMHSRGIHVRTVSHPILQDGYELIIRLKQRRWKCTNEYCGFEANEGFNFVNPRRRFSNASDYLIVDAMHDLTKSATSIASEFKTSASHVMDVFDKYISMERLPLSEAICIDEVHLEMDSKCKYVMVVQDFVTGDPIDILVSRRNEYTEPFFSSISLVERSKVRYLISDMYNPYIQFANKYFPNAVSIVDSFHVCQWIISSIINYIRNLEKDLIEEIRRINAEMLADNRKQYEIRNMVKPYSDRLYILKRYRWIVTKNNSDVDYSFNSKYDRHFGYFMTVQMYEEKLFEYYPKLKKYRDWKEKYIRFNSVNAGNPEKAAIELDELIDFYAHGSEKIFNDFAVLLKRYRTEIVNSFIMMTKTSPAGESYQSRLSNGPIESLNRKAKDLKRLCRGISNFEHLRNRFLYATRKNPIWNGKIR